MIGDQPIHASRRSAQWCIAMTERLWENREGMIAEAERQEAKAAFGNALQVLAKLSDESAVELFWCTPIVTTIQPMLAGLPTNINIRTRPTYA